MRYIRFGRQYMVRLDAGEEIVQAIAEFAADQRIDAGSVSGIGSAHDVVLGACDATIQDPATPLPSDDLLIVSLVGNLTIRRGRPCAHLHVTLAAPGHDTLSGHLVSGRVKRTCELVVSAPGGYVQRVSDPRTGLDVLDM